MPSSSSAGTHLRRLIAALGALVLVPLAVVLAAAPAHADTAFVSGDVYDALGDPVSGVTVQGLTSPAYTTGDTATTDSEGHFVLPLSTGTYHLKYSKSGYTTQFLGGGTGVDLVVDGSGQVFVDGEPAEDNVVEDVTLQSSATYSVTGTVKNASSTALSGIEVVAFVSGDEEDPIATATTNGSGAYTLGLHSGVYNIRFTDPTHTYLTTWYDGTGDPVDVTVTGNKTLTAMTLQTPAPGTEYPIAGAVVDALGDPVNGVTVTVDGVGGSTDTGTGSTAGEGAYSVPVLPGTYRVTYAKTGFVTTKYGGLSSPSTVTVANNGDLSVSPAEDLVGNRLGDLTLESTPFAKTGTVETTGDVGISGITVRAFPEGSTDAADVVDTTTSAAGGSYTIDLPIGTYDLQYADNDPSSPSYDSATLASVQVAQGGALSVGGSSVAGLPDVQLNISSADTPHPVVGSLVDVTGAEIDGLSVIGVPQGSGEQGDDTTGADGALGDHGRFRLMLKPGTYQVQVLGGSDWVDTSYVGEGTSTATVQVQLNGTVLVNGVEAVGGELGSTEVAGKTKYTLGGTVKEASTGLPGISVKAYADSDLEHPVASTTSGANGVWSLASANGLVVGSYVIEFSGSSGGVTYDKTYFGGSTPEPVVMAQGGIALVDGSTLTPANTLPDVSMTRSSADTTHLVTGEVDDLNGDPVSGVTVTPSGGPTSTTDGTDADGIYELMLKPGTYQLGFAKSGFASATYPGAGETAVSIVVQLDGTVLAGSTPTTGGELDPVTLTQSAGTTSISGRVLSDGSPVTGITVEVFNEGDLTADGLARPAVTTAANGTWTVTGLKIGTYVVRFTDNVAAAPTYVQTYYGGTTTATAKVVKVGQGNAVTVDEVSQPSGALGDTSITVADANTTYDVTGMVSDANGDPIVGATATATPQGSGTLASDTTDSDGAYVLALKAGTYRISFTASGFATATYPGPGETPVDVVVQSGGTVKVGTTTVPGGELDPVTLDQTAGSTSISGRVLSDGSPVTGITVEVFNEGDLTADGLARPAVTTAANGTWTVTGLKIGSYTVRFTDNVAAAPTYVQQTFGPVKVGQGGQVFVDDVLKPSGALGDVTVVEADENTLHPIIGDVTDANFDPLEDVTVTAEPQGGSPAADPVTTDEDGAYTLQVKAGSYKIKFSRTGFASKYYLNSNDAQAVVVVSASGVVTITGDGTVPDNTLDSVELASTTTTPLTGTVVDEDAQPIAGIKVRAMRDGETTTSAEATTGANGTFTIQLPVGTYTIAYVDTVVAAPTYITAYYGGGTGRLVKVATGGAVTDNETGDPIAALGTVTLSESDPDTTYDLKGFVYDADFNPVDGVTVRVLPVGKTADSAALYTGVSGADEEAEAESGYYRIPVKAGKYWLKYSAPGLATTYLVDYDTNGPVTVTVAANGGISAPGYDFTGNQIDDVQLLLPAAAFSTAPKVTGKYLVGQVVSTTFGTLQGATIDKDYVTIEWFLDGKPADDYSFGNYYEKFRIPLAAATKKLSYRITIDDPDTMRASTVFTSKAVAVPKAAAKLKATYKAGKLTVTLAIPGMPKPTGTITVKDGKKKLAPVKVTRKSKKGTVVVKLKLKPGKHKLTLSYAGTKTINAAATKVTVKVPKR